MQLRWTRGAVRRRSPTGRDPAHRRRLRDHLGVQGRWTPLWPVLAVRGPNRLATGKACRQLSNSLRPFHAECGGFVQCAVVTTQGGLTQGLAVSFLRSRHSPPEGKPPSQSMSWLTYPVGRFSGVHRWPVLAVRRGFNGAERSYSRRSNATIAMHWEAREASADQRSIQSQYISRTINSSGRLSKAGEICLPMARTSARRKPLRWWLSSGHCVPLARRLRTTRHVTPSERINRRECALLVSTRTACTCAGFAPICTRLG